MEAVLCKSPTPSVVSISSSASDDNPRPVKKFKSESKAEAKISTDDLHLNASRNETTNKINISELKDSLINSKKLDFATTSTTSTTTTESRKRSNTWPIKKVELTAALTDMEKKFGEKLLKELGVESGKQLKNPWGNLSYSQLIEKAIENSPWKSLTLQEIYVWFTKFVPFFKDKGHYKSTIGWKNSIRHNLSLHKRFIRVAVFQRHLNAKGTATKRSIRFVWTSLKYKPNSVRAIQNRSLLELNQIRQHESFYQNSLLFHNQAMFNAGYNLNQPQMTDPNQMLNFYKIFQNNQNYLMMNSYLLHQQQQQQLQQQQQAQNNTFLPKTNENDKKNPMNPIEFNDTSNKCSCSTCIKSINQEQISSHQRARIHYPIPLPMNPSLFQMQARYLQQQQQAQAQYSQMLPNYEKPQKRQQTQSLFNLDGTDQEDINIDVDSNSKTSTSSDTSFNEVTYNYKRKLMDRYIQEDETDVQKSSSSEVKNPSQLDTFLKTNKINSNLLKLAEQRNSRSGELNKTDQEGFSLSQLLSSNTCGSSSGNSNNGFGLLKTILNKKN